MYVTALTAMLVPASIGVVTVHASPTCEKFVRSHVSVPVRNKVSKATAIAWEKWRIGHPNWKPNPKIKRPRYRMTQHESLEKVAFACQVPTDPNRLDIMFPVAELLPPQPEVDMAPEDVPPVETTDATVPYTISPVAAGGPPVAELVMPPAMFVSPPFVPPLFGAPRLPPVSVPSSPPVGIPESPGVPGGGPGTPVTGITVPPTIPGGDTGVPVIGTTVPPTIPGGPGGSDTPGTPEIPEVPVAPVPEPSSVGLAALGMGSTGVMALRARRSKAAVSL